MIGTSSFSPMRGSDPADIRVLAVVAAAAPSCESLLRVAAQLAEGGHSIVVTADEQAAAMATTLGLLAARFRYSFTAAHDPGRHAGRGCGDILMGPAIDLAFDVLDAVEAFAPHVVVTDAWLAGAVIGGERAQLPVVAVCASEGAPYPIPLRRYAAGSRGNGVRRLLRALRDAVDARHLDRRRGALNRVRAEFALAPVAHAADQYRSDTVMTLTTAMVPTPDLARIVATAGALQRQLGTARRTGEYRVVPSLRDLVGHDG